MTTPHDRKSRRQFLQRASALVGAASLGLQAQAQAQAQTQTQPPDYKALVCVFFLGGNDGHHLLVPMGAAAHASYRAGRGILPCPTTMPACSR